MSKTARTAMNRLFFAVFFASAVLCVPAALVATDFPHYDHMNDEAKAEYLGRMVDSLETALSHAGHADQANQVEKLFTDVEPGDSMTLGMVELESNVDRARVADAERYTKDHNARRLDVEDALFVTIEKNMIKLTTPEMNEVLSTMATFHSTTYAEFEAMRPVDQRRLITLCANLGFFSLQLRTLVEDTEKGKASDPAQEKTMFQDERQVVNAQFLSERAPGYSKVTQRIADAYAKLPNDPGVLYTVTLFIFDETKNVYETKMKDMEDSTYHLPDRSSQSSPAMQFLADLAKKLRDATPQTPAVVSPPAAAPAPAPAAQGKTEAPDDDPIGEGGFITPPTK